MTRIKTNRRWRAFLYGYDLTPKERAEFDYIPEGEIEDRRFFRYRRAVYDLGEFTAIASMPSDNPLSKWDGYLGDSFFSGVVIRYSSDGEFYQVGTYLG